MSYNEITEKTYLLLVIMLMFYNLKFPSNRNDFFLFPNLQDQHLDLVGRAWYAIPTDMLPDLKSGIEIDKYRPSTGASLQFSCLMEEWTDTFSHKAPTTLISLGSRTAKTLLKPGAYHVPSN